MKEVEVEDGRLIEDCVRSIMLKVFEDRNDRESVKCGVRIKERKSLWGPMRDLCPSFVQYKTRTLIWEDPPCPR